MSEISRRKFLGASGAAVAAGALAPPLLTGAGSDGPHSAFGRGELAAGAVPDSARSEDQDLAVIVHILDARAGQVSAYVGDQHITFTDRDLVARVMRAHA